MSPHARLWLLAAAALAGCAADSPAPAAQAAPPPPVVTTFTVDLSADLAAPPAAVYAKIAEVGRWWSSDHSWSGEAANMTLEPKAGGCFCETWGDGSVEHGRVVFAERAKTLRLEAALGPLQELGVSGVLTFALAPSGEATKLGLSYRVKGDPADGLGPIAPLVRQVLQEQLDRLARYVETGTAQATQ